MLCNKMQLSYESIGGNAFELLIWSQFRRSYSTLSVFAGRLVHRPVLVLHYHTPVLMHVRMMAVDQMVEQSLAM
jgi:hypothetical protein